jgi:hypothetical protein
MIIMQQGIVDILIILLNLSLNEIEVRNKYEMESNGS